MTVDSVGCNGKLEGGNPEVKLREASPTFLASDHVQESYFRRNIFYVAQAMNYQMIINLIVNFVLENQ